MVCKISQPKRGPWENCHRLRNNFATLRHPLRNQGLAAKRALRCEIISQPHSHPLRNTPLAHECHFAAPIPLSQLQNALRNLQSLKNSNFAAIAPFRSWFRSCETTPWHMSAISQPYPLILQLQNGLQNGLRKHPSDAKLTLYCENASPLQKLQPSLGLHF